MMVKKVRNIAIVLAAGTGSRTGFDKPKQLVNLAGLPMVQHVINRFNLIDSIDEIIIVASKESHDAIEKIVLSMPNSKVTGVISGGNERCYSSLAAIEATRHYVKDYIVNLIFHDAVRPLVSKEIIESVVTGLEKYNAVDVAIKVTDTIVSVTEEDNTITDIPSRSQLRSGQTPQGFRHEIIDQAYCRALRDPQFATTDDCGVVLKYLPEEKILVVDGDNHNIKLTYKEDLYLLDKLMQVRTRAIYDNRSLSELVQLKDKVIIILGGTSGIGAAINDIARTANAIALAVGSDEVDITNVEQVRHYFKKIHDQYGRIDYVINSAGVLYRMPLTNMRYEDIVRTINTNFLGAVNVAAESFQYLKETQGHLINFTSSSYTYGRALYSVYSASKAAVVNLTQALAEEWAGHNIRVNCINPQRTKTPMRVKAFGVEDENSLLKAADVAIKTVALLNISESGQVFDIKKLY
ncbi:MULTISPECIES: bifunctional cytidylyltransferase/SDR family oxidoreductase [Pectobacterium]|uniref:bifunctional cytidylyltransferase/SDR family oxidoreductase n=1 Tax=Pectobacterium TaxID=122277 RepID=UPI001F47C576|nr:bifunctional cytidylyltransferase/SDR family oxidoreductase [Pectobacterium versatile]